MAVAAVAEHVDDHVALEFLAEFGGDAGHVHHRLGVVAVDVEDGRLDPLGHVRGIGRRSRVGRAGGEADLVVDDEVDGAAGAVAAQLRKVQCLGDQALAGEGGVPVHQQAHDLVARLVVALVLLGPHLAEDDRVDRFQVRGVGGQGQMDGVAVEHPVGRGAQMVLDVARALDVVGAGGDALKLGKNGHVGLAHDAGQHVQPAPVGHPQHHLLDAQLRAPFEDLLERRDHALAAVEPEALGPGVLHAEEFLETVGLDQALVDGALALEGELGLVAYALDAPLDPGLLLRLHDVHELDADGSAVRFAENLKDLAQGRGLQSQNVVDEDGAVHVGFREAVGFGVELGVVGIALQAQGVEAGDEMAAHPVGADHHQRVERILGRRPDLVGAEQSAEGAGGDGGRGNPAVAVAAADDARVRGRPAGPAQLVEDGPAVLLQAREICDPACVHRGGVP